MTVAFLCILYAFSSIDRLILSLLVVPMKADLGISDTQVGILFGLSFALLYTLAGIPLARIADHGNRKWLTVAGVLLWSGSTATSVLSVGFTSLLVCRAGVAIGEAVLTPAAISIIADLYPSSRRAQPTAKFVATGNIVGLSASATGGLLLQLATRLSTWVGITPWRLTLLQVGLAGIVVGLIFAAIVREPSRQGASARSDNRAGWSHLTNHWRFYFAFFGGVGMSVMVSYSLIAWIPTVLMKAFHLSGPQAGYLFGLLGITFGLLGILRMPWLVRRAALKGGAETLPTVAALSSVVGLAATLFTMSAGSLVPFALGLGVSMAVLPGVALLPSLVVQAVAPPRFRGQLMAVFLLISNLLGLGLGPMLSALLSDHVFAGRGGMPTALAALATGALLVAIVLFALARAPYRRLLADQSGDQPAPV